MLTSFVERDGMARTVLLLLGMTTIACLSYTWGYSEGMHNARTLVRMEQQHNEDVAASIASRQEAENKRTGHGLSAYKEQQLMQQQQQQGEARVSKDGGHSSLPPAGASHGIDVGSNHKAKSTHTHWRHKRRLAAAAAAAAA